MIAKNNNQIKKENEPKQILKCPICDKEFKYDPKNNFAKLHGQWTCCWECFYKYVNNNLVEH